MFKEYFIYNIPQTTLAAGTGVVFTELDLKIYGGDFIFKRTIHTATDNRILNKILDSRTGRFLFKGSDDLRSVSGTSLTGITANGFLPYNWPHPYKGINNAIMQFFFSDFSGAPNTLNIAYHGDIVGRNAPQDKSGKDYDVNDRRVTVPLVYEIPSVTTAAPAGSQVQSVLVTDNDADFICTKITGIFTGAGFVTVQDLARDIYWQNIKTYNAHFAGNGQFPNVLTSPIFIKANSRILLTYENGTAAPNTATIYLHGYKRF